MAMLRRIECREFGIVPSIVTAEKTPGKIRADPPGQGPVEIGGHAAGACALTICAVAVRLRRERAARRLQAIGTRMGIETFTPCPGCSARSRRLRPDAAASGRRFAREAMGGNGGSMHPAHA